MRREGTTQAPQLRHNLREMQRMLRQNAEMGQNITAMTTAEGADLKFLWNADTEVKWLVVVVSVAVTIAFMVILWSHRSVCPQSSATEPLLGIHDNKMQRLHADAGGTSVHAEGDRH